MKKYNKAFTLAEVLITLGIIGVVAALTIPTLMKHYQQKTIETQVKQVYSTLQQVIKFSEANDMVIAEAGNSGSQVWLQNWYNDYVSKYLKTDKYCTASVSGCWHSQGIVKDLVGIAPIDEQSNGMIGNIPAAFVDKQGRFYTMDISAQSTIRAYWGVNTSTGRSMEMFFDVNGVNKPNVIGKDIYIVVWTDRGLLPAGYDITPAQVVDNCLNGNGYFCLSYMMQHDWKIDDRVWNR